MGFEHQISEGTQFGAYIWQQKMFSRFPIFTTIVFRYQRSWPFEMEARLDCFIMWILTLQQLNGLSSRENRDPGGELNVARCCRVLERSGPRIYGI